MVGGRTGRSVFQKFTVAVGWMMTANRAIPKLSPNLAFKGGRVSRAALQSSASRLSTCHARKGEGIEGPDWTSLTYLVTPSSQPLLLFCLRRLTTSSDTTFTAAAAAAVTTTTTSTTSDRLLPITIVLYPVQVVLLSQEQGPASTLRTSPAESL